MAIVDFSLFKGHVRADDFSEDDQYLQHILQTAEDAVISATYRTVEDLTQMGGGQFPKQLQQAVMMLAAHWYNQREGVAGVQMHEVPHSISALIKPFRKLSR